jgi:hypothetical protein
MTDSASPRLEAIQGDVCDDAVPDEQQRHDTDIDPVVVEPDGLDGRELGDRAERAASAGSVALVEPAAAGELDPEQEAVAVEAVVEPPEPGDERRDVLHVVASRYEEDHGDDGGERGALLDVHEHGADGEAQALRDEHAVEHDGEGEDEGPRPRVQPAHPVQDEHERRGQAQLHGQVGGGAGREVGGEAVHPRGPLLEQHGPLEREGEDGVVEREEAPEHGEEEDERRPVLQVRRRRAPPQQPRQARHAQHLEDAQLVERLVTPLLEPAPEQHQELRPPPRRPLRPARRRCPRRRGGIPRADVKLHRRRDVPLVRRRQLPAHLLVLALAAAGHRRHHHPRLVAARRRRLRRDTCMHSAGQHCDRAAELRELDKCPPLFTEIEPLAIENFQDRNGGGNDESSGATTGSGWPEQCVPVHVSHHRAPNSIIIASVILPFLQP